MRKNLRKSEVVIAKNESHFIATEAQEETAEFILNFLNKHENSNL
jgi:pimeloyl-ACP methyl ester carboxylesterase